MSTISIIRIVFWALIAASCVAFGISVVRYLVQYKVFELLFAKIKGDIHKMDTIRRDQMKLAYERKISLIDQESGKSKPKLIQIIYHRISMSGITSVIPGFSELAFIVISVVVSVALGAGIGYLKGIFPGIVAGGGLIFIIWYLLSILSYKRKVSVEGQLLDFVNMVVLSSRQYSNLIDIMGCIYEEFKDPLKTALEECYVHARKSNNSDLALQLLKDKFDSVQFSFVIDNLTLCSRESGNYFDVASDLSNTVSIYIESFDKKQATLRNAKLTLTIMALLSGVIFYALGMFLGGIGELFSSNAGFIGLIAMILLYVYALNMKAED